MYYGLWGFSLDMARGEVSSEDNTEVESSATPTTMTTTTTTATMIATIKIVELVVDIDGGLGRRVREVRKRSPMHTRLRDNNE